MVIEKGTFLRGFLSTDGGLSYTAHFLRKDEPDPVVDVILLENVQEEDTEVAAEIILQDVTAEETVKKNLFPENQEDVDQSLAVTGDKNDEEESYEVDEQSVAEKNIVRDGETEVRDNQETSGEDNTAGTSREEIKQKEETRMEDGDDNDAGMSRTEDKQKEERNIKDDDDDDGVSKLEGCDEVLKHKVTETDGMERMSTSVFTVVNDDTNMVSKPTEEVVDDAMEIDSSSDEDSSKNPKTDTVRIKHPNDKFCSQSSSEWERNRSAEDITVSKKKRVTVSLSNEALDDMKDLGEDSDTEENDKDSFNENRIARKTARWSKRNSSHTGSVSAPEEDQENKKVIEDFQKYLLLRTNDGDKCGTISKVMGHIIYYPDSYLRYLTDKDPSFKLEMNVNFGATNYRDIKFPLDWIQETTSEDPSRCVEKLKAHSKYRQFIKYKCGNSNLPSSDKNVVVEFLDNVHKEVTAQNLYNKFSIQVNNEKIEKDRARMTLNPDSALNVANAVKVWNSSDIQREIQKEMTQLYAETIKNKSLKEKAISNRKFTQFSHWVRFNLILSDKNRPAVYKFRNIDLVSNNEIWFPEGCDFDSLPPNWNIHARPSPNTPPSAYLLSLPGTS